MRKPSEVITEVISLVRDGIKSYSNDMEVVVWNWSWNAFYEPPCREIIDKLPADVLVMTGFERGGVKLINGEERIIDEYSLSFVGPSKQFVDTVKAVNENGLRIMAKLQIGTTHELATVPNLPLIGNLYDKAMALKSYGIKDFMGCWNFGNMLTANTASFDYFLNTSALLNKHDTMMAFATEYFPGCVPEWVVAAWREFAVAMDSYPFSTSFLYSGPLNYALSYPLLPEPVSDTVSGRSWLMDYRGDNLENSLKTFDLDTVINCLKSVFLRWKTGVEYLVNGLKSNSSHHGLEELNNANVCYHIFRSGWNIYRVYKLRRSWNDAKFKDYFQIVEDEIENLQQVLPIVKEDRRFGFHPEAQGYMYDSNSIEKKIKNLKWRLSRRTR